MMLVALDVGGANLKLADGCGWSVSRPFALWRSPERLTEELTELLAQKSAATCIAATMTGELADCYRTKAEGVRAIVRAICAAAGSREVLIYCVDGALVTPTVAAEQPWRAAASNWHALARFAGRFLPHGTGLLIDVGSTTTDLIPIVAGNPVARGTTDPERLIHSELVYTGVERSPVCAVVRSLPWRGHECPVAQELFATTWDAYVVLRRLPEEPAARNTADGRAATREAARQRLARAICADGDTFDEQEILAAAESIRNAQLQLIVDAARRVLERVSEAAGSIIISGQGEFLARSVAECVAPEAELISLGKRLGPELSRCAPAYALAVLAHDELMLKAGRR